MMRGHEAALLRLLTILIAVPLLLVGCGSDEESGDDLSPDQPVTESTPGEAAQATGTSASDQPTQADQTGDGSFDKPVPTGPAPTQQVAAVDPSRFDADGDGFYTFGELQEAVENLYPAYEWPSDYRVTPELMLSGFAETPDGQWEVPYEYTLVGLYHLCAWERAWLDAYREGDQSLMEQSLYQLQVVALDNPVFIYLRGNLAVMFERAALGDPSLIQQYVDQSCSSYEFLTPEAGIP